MRLLTKIRVIAQIREERLYEIDCDSEEEALEKQAMGFRKYEVLERDETHQTVIEVNGKYV